MRLAINQHENPQQKREQHRRKAVSQRQHQSVWVCRTCQGQDTSEQLHSAVPCSVNPCCLFPVDLGVSARLQHAAVPTLPPFANAAAMLVLMKSFGTDLSDRICVSTGRSHSSGTGAAGCGTLWFAGVRRQFGCVTLAFFYVCASRCCKLTCVFQVVDSMERASPGQVYLSPTTYLEEYMSKLIMVLLLGVRGHGHM